MGKAAKKAKNKEIAGFHLNTNNATIRVRRASDDMQRTFYTNEEHYLKKLEAFSKGTDGHVVSLD